MATAVLAQLGVLVYVWVGPVARLGLDDGHMVAVRAGGDPGPRLALGAPGDPREFVVAVDAGDVPAFE